MPPCTVHHGIIIPDLLNNPNRKGVQVFPGKLPERALFISHESLVTCCLPSLLYLSQTEKSLRKFPEFGVHPKTEFCLLQSMCGCCAAAARAIHAAAPADSHTELRCAPFFCALFVKVWVCALHLSMAPHGTSISKVLLTRTSLRHPLTLLSRAAR